MDLKDRLGVEIVGPHRDDAQMLLNLENQARMFGLADPVRNVTPDRFLDEGDAVFFGDHEFEVLHCPGHSPGHVVFYNRAASFAHVGDVLFSGSIGRTDLPGGDHAALVSSIKNKLFPLGDEIGFICGHGPGGRFGRPGGADGREGQGDQEEPESGHEGPATTRAGDNGCGVHITMLSE